MAEKGKTPLIPNFIWDQGKGDLVVVIHLKNIEFPLIKIEDDKIYLKCVAEKEKKLHEITINLYDDIDINQSTYGISNKGVLFDLKKQADYYWPRLTNEWRDEIQKNEVSVLEFLLKKTETSKRSQSTNKNKVDAEEQASEQVSETIPEITENYALKLASYSRRLVHANNPAVYKIVAKDESIVLNDIEVIAETPDKKIINATIFASNSPNTYGIKYIPKKVGTHILNVFVRKELTLVLLTEVYNVNLIKIEEPQRSLEQFRVNFTVDCSEAGEGELQIIVEFGCFRLLQHCNIEKLDSGKYRATFTPDVPGDYFITIKYNGKPIKAHSDFTFCCPVSEFISFFGVFPKETVFPTGKYYRFSINNSNAPLFFGNDVSVRVVGPLGEFLARTETILPNFVEVSFLLKEPGTYSIHTTVKGNQLVESPHEIIAFNASGYSQESATLCIPNRRRHSNKLLHLSKIPVNKVATFFLKYTKLNEVDNTLTLKIIITDPKGEQVPVLMMPYNSVFLVEFTPKIIGCHKITVHCNGLQVDGSPIKANAFADKKSK